MLYKTGLIRKEWSYAYFENPNSLRSSSALGMFQGMLSFAVFFVLQTVKDSVLSEKFSYLFETSYFSTAFLYLFVSYTAMTLYFITKMKDLSYTEIYDNRWYTMVHLGYSVPSMVLAKLFAQWINALFVFAVGFITTAALTSFLKAPFILSYLISLFIAGSVNTTVLLILTLTVSLTVRDDADSRSVVIVSALTVFLLQFPTGFFAILCDRDRMRTLSSLTAPSGGSIYWILLGAVCTLCIVYCIVRAMQIAQLFHAPPVRSAPKISSKWDNDVRVVIKTQVKNREILNSARQLAKLYAPKKRKPFLSVLFTALLAVFVVAMLLIDALLLAFNYASPEKETSIMGFIPYIFQSSTMEPTVHYNDIAFFENVDQYVEISEGDIILFKDDVGIVQVRRANVIYTDAATGDILIDCDIDNYPTDAIQDIMKTVTGLGSVYGRLVGVNRNMGAIILFANTVLGRIIFLLVPTVLIFYARKIRQFFEKIGRGRSE